MPKCGEPRKITYRPGRFFNATVSRAHHETTQIAKMQTSMRWLPGGQNELKLDRFQVFGATQTYT